MNKPYYSAYHLRKALNEADVEDLMWSLKNEQELIDPFVKQQEKSRILEERKTRSSRLEKLTEWLNSKSKGM